jgi:hypothetical protein
MTSARASFSDELFSRWQHVQSDIHQACARASRDEQEVALLAVSKFQPAEAIAALHAAGQRDFGENYVQEALEKMQQLQDCDITWHLIGPLQSNKTAEVAANFAWVHSVDRVKIARRLNDQRPVQLPPLNICLQVNIDNEDSKSGCSLEQLPALVEAVMALPRLRLRGLMVIPKAGETNAFATLAKTHAAILARLPALADAPFDSLSMGMSADLAEAIAAGSTWVRIGTAIFGVRPTTT